MVKAIKAVNDLAVWLKRSDRILEAADKNAAAGHYSAALHTLEPIEREDRKMTAAIAAVVPQQPDSSTTQPAAVTADLNPFARPGEVADVVKKDPPPPQELPPGQILSRLDCNHSGQV